MLRRRRCKSHGHRMEGKGCRPGMDQEHGRKGSPVAESLVHEAEESTSQIGIRCR
jgi:hypothetical protein